MGMGSCRVDLLASVQLRGMRRLARHVCVLRERQKKVSYRVKCSEWMEWKMGENACKTEGW